MLFSIAIITIIVSLSLLIWSLRGKRYAIPAACRVCNFDVASIIAAGSAGARCPECGKQLDTPNALRTFRRRRRSWAAAFSGVVLLLSAGMAGSVLYGANLSKYVYPALSDALLGEVIKAAGPGMLPGAAGEASMRCTQAKVSNATLTTLARAALARQQSGLAWDTHLGEIIEQAIDAGVLSQQDANQFLRNAFSVSIEPLRAVEPGRTSWKFVITRTRSGPTSVQGGVQPSEALRGTRIEFRLREARLDGKPVYSIDGPNPPPDWLNRIPFSAGEILQFDSCSVANSIDVPPRDGQLNAVLVYDVTVGDTTSQLTLATSLWCTSTAPDLVEPVTDDETGAQMRSAFSIRAWRTAPLPDGRIPVMVEVAYSPQKIPIAACFDLRVSPPATHGRWHVGQFPLVLRPLGRVHTPDMVQRTIPLEFLLPADWRGDSIDVQLAADLDARRTFIPELSDCAAFGTKLRLWGKPLAFDHVPVPPLGK